MSDVSKLHEGLVSQLFNFTSLSISFFGSYEYSDCVFLKQFDEFNNGDKVKAIDIYWDQIKDNKVPCIVLPFCKCNKFCHCAVELEITIDLKR